MLKKTLNAHENINSFLNLKSLIKNNNKGYKPVQSRVLRWDQIMKFMTKAEDHIYLVIKVIL